jgi:hypothetical protein
LAQADSSKHAPVLGERSVETRTRVTEVFANEIFGSSDSDLDLEVVTCSKKFGNSFMTLRI